MRGKRLGDFDVPELFRLWASGMPEREICQTLGIRHGSFYVLKDRLKLPPRLAAKPTRTSDDDEAPTAEEIAERAESVRATWSPEEEERRRVGWRRSQVPLRSFHFDHRNHAMTALDY
jgi:hypothetical protein